MLTVSLGEKIGNDQTLVNVSKSNRTLVEQYKVSNDKADEFVRNRQGLEYSNSFHKSAAAMFGIALGTSVMSGFKNPLVKVGMYLGTILTAYFTADRLALKPTYDYKLKDIKETFGAEDVTNQKNKN